MERAKYEQRNVYIRYSWVRLQYQCKISHNQEIYSSAKCHTIRPREIKDYLLKFFSCRNVFSICTLGPVVSGLSRPVVR